MVTEAVVLTCLPNGFDPSDRLKVTVFVTPRLSTDGPDDLPLGNFGSFVVWPASLEALLDKGQLGIEFDGPVRVPAELDPTSPPPDPDRWTLLFDPDKVGVFASQPPAGKPGAGFQDLSKRTVRSFPTGSIANQVLDLYRDIALNAPTDFPSVTAGRLSTLRQLGQVSRNPEEAYKQLDSLIRNPNVEGGPGGFFDASGISSAAERDFLAFVQAQRFYERPGERDPLGPEKAPPPPEKPPIDFHGYCTFLGDYPRLLRSLGLAVDLLVKRPAGFGQESRIRVAVDPVPGLEFAAKEAARPWTNYEVSDRRFIARPRAKEGPLADGSLRLEGDWYRVHQIDVDGSALKTLNFAATVANLAGLAKPGQPSTIADEASLPALRTGGFVVTQDRRDQAVVAQIGMSVKHETARTGDKPADLFAEDVTRGTRPDVLDVGQPWRSLTERKGSYTVERGGGSTAIPVDPDEGFVKGASATSVPSEPDPDLYLHEAVFGWDGWSLAVKRPGQAIIDEAGENVDLPPPTPQPEFPLVTRFDVPEGKLPRLRFGRTYRFRARAVDLAGNSVPEADLVGQHQTPEHVFVRFDPIPSPAVVPRRRFSEGESLVRLVIRSTLEVSPTAYIELPRIRALADHATAATAYLDHNERWLAAPKTAVQLAEWHSMFDVGIGKSVAPADIDTAFAIASLESGSFIDPGPGASVVNTNPGAVPTDLSTHVKGTPLQSGEYVIRDTDDLALPYLPDPASAGVSFTVLPGDPSTRLVPWPGADWPDRKPIQLQILDGGLTTDPQQAPAVASRLLTVKLRQAEMVVVRLSSFPTRDGLKTSGILGLLPQPLTPAQAADAKAGRHWMLTPFQEITIVHAVEKPLAAPVVSVDDAGVHRNEGETFAVLQGHIDNHARSTGRLDIEARWTEPIDDTNQKAPHDADNLGEVEGGSHVADFLLEASEDACQTGRDDAAATSASPAVHRVRHEFRDTKHRNVTYHAIATTRFREYFPAEITSQPGLITNVGADRSLNVPSSRRPDPPDVQYVIPTFRWVDETYRGLPAGMTLDALMPNVAAAVGGIRGNARLLDRGARAERVALPPGVLLPLVQRRVRKAGLRVYLGRPWYSSGADELLAVVLPDQPYILWPLDVGKGLLVEAKARAAADLAAAHLLDQGVIRPSGGATLRASERLARSVQGLSPSAAEAIDVTAEPDKLLTSYQVSRLTDLLAQLPPSFFATGDPEKFVTRYGSDPIWVSDAPASGPWIHQFPLRTQVGTGLSLAEAPGNTVAAVGHRPRFDPDRGLWYCDIDIDAGTSYFPFVKLGLARYQPNSIDGVHLSRVIAPEWAQLMPERDATLARPTSALARVTLRGPAGYSNVARVVLGSAATGPEGMALSRFAVAQVERLPAAATTDLAWRPAGDAVRLDQAIKTAYSVLEYSGQVPVPPAGQGEQLRLTIREYEMLETDASQADDTVTHTIFTAAPLQPPEVGVPVGLVPHPDDKPVRFRLVYAAQLSL